MRDNADAATAHASRLTGVEVGLRVFELLVARDRITVGEVARTLGISRSSAHRHLATLESRGYASLSSTGRGYIAGPALFELAGIRGVDRATKARYRPVLQDAHDATDGEAVHIAVLVGDQVLAVDGRRSQFEDDIGPRVGMTATAHAMAAGKLLLAACNDQQVAAILPNDPLPTRAPATIRSRRELFADLERIRKRGFAITHGESEPGVNSVAVPLDGSSWRDRSALVVSVPLTRGSEERLLALARAASEVVARHRDAGTVQPWQFHRP
ncbi:IclR family transcriptional regulator [Ruicaihuangia caeni]|uniref:IclR family transcriptional regulator n=1 Tax=Ruicaihuangia caeni TaxID=3042517 RepID=A0AAW6TC79_9MICO|nr:IclR family transcriptional regulator [Klugiella sp. YN-L-19]MDI2099608.1 IclR family transcriptional regulator [Klugiella sp. YN-L-19]